MSFFRSLLVAVALLSHLFHVEAMKRRNESFEENVARVEPKLINMVQEDATAADLCRFIEENNISRNRLKRVQVSLNNDDAHVYLVHLAVLTSNTPEKLDVLISKGADYHQRDSKDRTALDLAIYLKKPLLIRYLVPLVQDTNQIPVYATKAMFTGDISCMYEVLRAHNALVFGKPGTPIFKANDGISEEIFNLGIAIANHIAYASNLYVEKFYETAKQYPAQLTSEGNTCLHTLALLGRHGLIIGVFKQCPLDIFIPNQAGFMPIHVAVLEFIKREKDFGIIDESLLTTIQLLVTLQQAFEEDVPSIIESRTTLGFTPLHLACMHGCEPLMEQLLTLGADIDALKIIDGLAFPLTPRMFARKKDKEAQLNKLLEDLSMLRAKYQTEMALMRKLVEEPVVEEVLAATSTPQKVLDTPEELMVRQRLVSDHVDSISAQSPSKRELALQARQKAEQAKYDEERTIQKAYLAVAQQEQAIIEAAKRRSEQEQKNIERIFLEAEAEDRLLQHANICNKQELDLNVHKEKLFSESTKAIPQLAYQQLLEEGKLVEQKTQCYEFKPLQPSVGRIEMRNILSKDPSINELLNCMRDKTTTAEDLKVLIERLAKEQNRIPQEIVAKRYHFNIIDDQSKPNSMCFFTLLHFAVTESSCEKIALLITLGADSSAYDHIMDTPLHRAIAIRRSSEIIALLEAYNYNPNLPNRYGHNAYMLKKMMSYSLIPSN